MSMSLVFAGSPAIAVPALRAVAGAGFHVAAVLTNPDTAKGRSGSPLPTPVALCAEELALPVIKSARIDDKVTNAVRERSPSLLVTFAYGALFPLTFLNLFPRGGINCHPSLLPKYRGAAPIQEAILKRDKVTGITIQYLAEKMDAGDIILKEEMPIGGRETTESLSAVAAERGAALLVQAVFLIEKNAVKRARQDERDASYCGKIGKDEGRIDWLRTADDIDAQIRAFTPWPLCRTQAAGKELLVLEAHSAETGPAGAFLGGVPRGGSGGVPLRGREEALSAGKSGTAKKDAPGTVIGVDKQEGILVQTGQGVLAMTRLQWESKKALDFRDFLNGARNFVGTMLE
jgi:methionyl-tRNA formyltransferase